MHFTPWSVFQPPPLLIFNNRFLVNKHHRAVFAGIETGTISYYKLSDDLNVLESIQTFNAHSSAAVVQCHFCPLRNWILSYLNSELSNNSNGTAYVLTVSLLATT